MSNIYPLRIVKVEREDDGPVSIQRCVVAGVLEQVDEGNVRAVAVAIVDGDGNTGHIYYTGADIAAMHYAVATLQSRVLSHGSVAPMDAEWDALSIPDGMCDPFLGGEE